MTSECLGFGNQNSHPAGSPDIHGVIVNLQTFQVNVCLLAYSAASKYIVLNCMLDPDVNNILHTTNVLC